MSPNLILLTLCVYFILLIIISFLTGNKTDSLTFFKANKQSPWYLVAFGMIGTSLSGVTFISLPGLVATSKFSYFQMVMGYLLGYLFISHVLLPLYYKLNITSIYQFLEQRFGFWSYKIGSFYFIISRLIGSSLRLFLVASVLQITLFDSFGIAFEATVAITILLIWIYTFRGGINTIVWTDSLQTLCMLGAAGIIFHHISSKMEYSIPEMMVVIFKSDYSQIFVSNWKLDNHFVKHFFSGAFITIVMTGLDQDMMQKNLTCKNIDDAKKNMFWFSGILVLANILFLSLGALLYIYADTKGINLPTDTDDVFPMLATQQFGTYIGLIFLLGVISAAYSSADSALTSLTTTFCVDFLNFRREDTKALQDTQKIKRTFTHIFFSILLLITVIVINLYKDKATIDILFDIAGYTYGPLLGLFTFGLFTRYDVHDKIVPIICIISPVFSYYIDLNSNELLFGYEFGFELLMLNGLITFLGLFIIKKTSRHR